MYSKPHSFFLEGRFGVVARPMSHDDYTVFQAECGRVIRQWQPGKWNVLARAVTEEWSALCIQRGPTKVFRQTDSGILVQKDVSVFSPPFLIKSGAFGVLLPTCFVSNEGRSIYVLVWIQKQKNSNYSQPGQMIATFSITNEFAESFQPRRCKVNPLDLNNLKFAIRHLYKDFPFDSFDKSFFGFWKDHFSRTNDYETPFDYDTGFKVQNEVFGDDIPRGAPIKLQFSCSPDNEETWDVFLFFNEGRDPLLSVIDCLPTLYRTIRHSAFTPQNRMVDLWDELLSLVDTSSWGLGKEESPQKALKAYIEFTFERLYSDSNTPEAHPDNFPSFVPPLSFSESKPSSLLFCTGLVECKTGNANYIYGLASDLNSEDDRYGTVEWLYHRDPRKKPNPRLNEAKDERVAPKNHGLPYPANWTREQVRLIFEYRFGSLEQEDIIIDYAHLFFDHIIAERSLPPGNRRFPDCVTKHFRGFDETTLPTGCAGAVRDEYVPKEFKDMLNSAWRKTRKMLQGNYKIAVPTYFRHKIQLLVPLYLDTENNPGIPSVALVVKRNDEDEKVRCGCTYYCPTCLTLEQARNDSRVITPLEGTWLSPNHIQRTIEWLKTQLADDTEVKTVLENRSTDIKPWIDEHFPKMTRQEKIRAAIKILSDLEPF